MHDIIIILSNSILFFKAHLKISGYYNCKWTFAAERIREDRPITIKDDKGNTSKLIAEIVALFITAMDKLKLSFRSMDDLHGDLKVRKHSESKHFNLKVTRCINIILTGTPAYLHRKSINIICACQIICNMSYNH